MEQKTEASQAVDEKACIEWAERFYRNEEWFESAELSVAINAWAHACAYTRAALKAQPAPTEAAQGGKLLELFKLAIGTIAVHDQAEAERIAKMYRGAQLSGNSGELANKQVLENIEQVQGEDSARLDAVVEANRALLHERSQLGIKKYGCTLGEKQYPHRELLTHALLEALDLSNYLQAAIMGIDRASAETGGVKS